VSEASTPLRLERLERILAPLCRDPSRLAVTFEGPDGRFLAGSSTGAAAAGRGGPRIVHDVHVEGALVGRLAARGPGADDPGVTGVLESLAVALGELIEEARSRETLEGALRPGGLLGHDHADLEVELAHGRQQQRRIVSLVAPQVPGYQLASHYEAAREVGGDFFELFPVRGKRERLGVVIADVTGKGIAAALLMAFSRPLIHGAMDLARGPADALDRVNRILVEERRSTLFITAIAAIVDLASGRVRVANAGHEAPLLLPADGSGIREVEGGGVLLGAFAGLGLQETTLRLSPGDVLVLYTDGVTDAIGADGQRFGDDRLLATLDTVRGGSAQDVVDGLRGALDRFCASVEQADDVTIVAVGRRRES
jgi:sigma-B regulation protein RsbU (phosphoserine phosphatase)